MWKYKEKKMKEQISRLNKIEIERKRDILLSPGNHHLVAVQRFACPCEPGAVLSVVCCLLCVSAL